MKLKLMKCPALILQLTLRRNCGWSSCFSAPSIHLTIPETRSKQNRHKLRAALDNTAADLRKVVTVVHLSKPMVSRRVGMDSPPLVKDNMDSLLRARDNTGSLLLAKDSTGNLLRVRDNMGSSQVAMVDHHQTNLLMVDSRVAILPHRLHGGTKTRLGSDACAVSRLIKDTRDGSEETGDQYGVTSQTFHAILL
jgi:hypothetical protein